MSLSSANPSKFRSGKNGATRARTSLDASSRHVRHLLTCWPEVARRLHDARRVILFLDFDGTLTPLRRRPEDVQLKKPVRSLLRRLSQKPRVAVFVISGRRLADLRNRINVPGVRCLGLHGWEGRRPARSAVAARKFLRPARQTLGRRLHGLRGIRIKDKGPCFAVHYRGAPSASVRRARAIMRLVLRPLRHHARVLQGKKVWEVLPLALEDKGAAVRATLRRFSDRAEETLSIYIGDDTTDESAFAALPHGITVRVGRRKPTKARFSLRNPEEVKRLLERVEAVTA